MTHLTLVRHGETEWNHERRYQGHKDIPLNTSGCEQAECLRPHLDLSSYAAVYTSDLQRARQTTEILLQGKPYKADKRLREINLGEFEGLTHEEIQQKYPQLKVDWYSNPAHTPESVESITAMAERLQSFLQFVRAIHPEENILVVSHGGAISLMATLLLGVPIEKRWQFRLQNTAVSKIRFVNGGVYLESWNDTRHLTG